MEQAIIFGFILCAMALIGAGWVLFQRRVVKNWNRVFEAAARKFHLQFHPGKYGSSPSLTGRVHGFAVKVTQDWIEKSMVVVFRVAFPKLRTEMTIDPEEFASQLRFPPGGEEMEFADPRFRASSALTSPDMNQALAMLHPEARRIIGELITSAAGLEFALTRTSLETKQPAASLTATDTLSGEIEFIIRLVTLLTRPGSPKTLLRENYLAETETESKAAYLEAYAAVSRHLPITDAIIQDALQSGDARLAFQAVKAAGRPAFRRLPKLLRKADGDMAVEIIEYAAQHKARSLVPAFISAVGPMDAWEPKATLVDFLVALGDARLESFIQKELSHWQHWEAEYRRKCLETLAERGTLASLKFLHSLKGDLPRHEVEAAMAAIRRRLGDGKGGWLSLPETESGGGALSLSGDDAGAGQLSRIEVEPMDKSQPMKRGKNDGKRR